MSVFHAKIVKYRQVVLVQDALCAFAGNDFINRMSKFLVKIQILHFILFLGNVVRIIVHIKVLVDILNTILHPLCMYLLLEVTSSRQPNLNPKRIILLGIVWQVD